jgi:hypothetical protein
MLFGGHFMVAPVARRSRQKARGARTGFIISIPKCHSQAVLVLPSGQSNEFSVAFGGDL